MIRLLNYSERALIEQNPARNGSLLRIRALFHAYGIGRSFISFYADAKGDILICVQDNVAFLYLSHEQFAEEAAEFLSLTVNEVVCVAPLVMTGYRVTVGKSYLLRNYPKTCLPNVTNELQAGFQLLAKVFPESINSTTYARWYTDMSHRIRHGISQIYTLSGVCSGTAYLLDRGTLLVTQLGTLSCERGKGSASHLLYHMATDLRAREILVLSQNEDSDGFYEKVGFEQVARWYCYER